MNFVKYMPSPRELYEEVTLRVNLCYPLRSQNISVGRKKEEKKGKGVVVEAPKPNTTHNLYQPTTHS
jgi:hypothetical protein